ncbi:MAG: transporter related protein [Ilumatobacteraceae bacterium]|jgi:branched-chain amino acid transport system ATP-binding protein|nr:transporter related protein [Ilumatobacteraceae bacterium]
MTDGRVLDVQGLQAGYGQVTVLRDVGLYVDPGEVVVVLGANGAGKTTTLRAICQSVWTKGSIRVTGREMRGKDTADVVRAGVAHVPQGRGTFNDLTVLDNLEVGAYVRRDRKNVNADIELWFSIFPRLEQRKYQRAGSLSGGEQQMLAVARALMSRPKLLLLDEPSLGLAPLISQDLFRHFGAINREQGVTMLVVEQNANLAFAIAHRAYVLEAGMVSTSGSAAELREDDAVRRAYLGV